MSRIHTKGGRAVFSNISNYFECKGTKIIALLTAALPVLLTIPVSLLITMPSVTRTVTRFGPVPAQ